MTAPGKGDAANPRFINPATVHRPTGYTHVAEVTGPGRTIYVSGQIGLAADFKMGSPLGDFRTQAVQTFENLKNSLAAVGAGFDHVVKVNIYLVDISAHLLIFREVRDLYVDKATPPASTLVQVPRLALDGLLIEVEAIAAMPPD